MSQFKRGLRYNINKKLILYKVKIDNKNILMKTVIKLNNKL